MVRPARTSRRFNATTPRDVREVNLHRGRAEGNMFASNAISTGKYTALTLLPKNIFEQFKRVANIWFLIVSILQLLPLQLSPTSSWATIAPLSLVLAVTLAKDAYLDYRRHKSDREINNRLSRRWNDELGDFEETPWCELEVGNIVLLYPNDQVPADLVILATGENDYICYIETSNLDGESNLKIRCGVPDTAKIFTSPKSEELKISIRKLDSGSIQSEKPNNRLYRFEGNIRLQDHIRPVPLDNNNVILRGCAVKNTPWVLAVVIFTGSDSKLMMNSKAPPHKRSNVERRVNKYLAIVFGLLFAIAGLSTIISVIQTYSTPGILSYFSGQDSKNSGLNFITFMILYNGLVPISLYVTMDVVRVVQAKFIQWDLRMYHPETDRSAVAKTADLNEDLGQIEYIFSDKTGTLTENQMMFKKCSIRGKVYGNEEAGDKVCVVSPHPKFQFTDPSLLADLQEPQVREFLECLALCHTVVPDRKADGVLAYQAASPDEEALVLAAHSFGFTFAVSRGEFCTLDIEGKRKEYRLLGVNEFNSTRKRMSVVVRAVGEDEPAILFCKGADNVMMNLCQLQDSEEVRLINQQLFEFSVQGLRTLVIAKRILTKEQADDFETKWINGKKAIADREKRLDEVAEEFETDLDLLGITAIEDKIQEKVPETITALRAAGIKVWVLTGDKQETAINIGYSCKLLTQEMTIIVLNGVDKEEVKSKLMHFVGRFVYTADGTEPDLRRVPSQAIPANTPSSPFVSDGGRSPSRPFRMGRALATVDEHAHVDLESINIGLVVNGESLQLILSDIQCIKWFTILACISKSVICCRASPLQKAEVVRLIKSYVSFRPLTLAVGDGANDVSMIQEAHVGVGIIGNEGMQAVNCSDYSISRFHFLLPLLFLHGRWNYHRITKVILYSFYKNFLLILPMFYFSFLNLYSGTALYDSWLIMSYNVFFTSLPIIALGASDTDSDATNLLRSPSNYTSGILGLYFNAKVFLRWVIMAIVHSLLIFALILLPSLHFSDPNGNPEGLTSTGTVAFYAIVQCVTYVILLNAKSWNRNFLIAAAASLLFFYPFIFFYDLTMFPAANMIGVSTFLFTCPSNLLSMWLTPLVMISYNFTTWYMHTYLKRSEKIDPARTYVLNSPRSVMLRAGKFIQLNEIVSFKGLSKKPESETLDDFSYSKWTLRFSDDHFEYSFRRFQTSRRMRFMRVMFWIFFIFLLVAVVTDMQTTDRSAVYSGLRITLLVIMFCICLFAHTRLFARHYELVILVVVVGGMAAKIASDLMLSNDGSMSTAIVPIITFVLFNISTFKLILLNGIFMVVYLIKLIVVLSSSEKSILDLIIIVLSYFALLWGITAVSAYVGYTLERESRDAFVKRRQLEGEYRRGQEMLSNLLPKFVKDRVKSGERNIADDQGVLTVLFCDIYEFEELCEDPNLDLFQFLNNYFLLLDSQVERYGLTKIETVNKTYMVCAGLAANEQHFAPSVLEKHHSVRVLEFAFKVLQRLEHVTQSSGKKFSVKIGVHVGQVFSGVVGLHKPQFSLIGDTVNYASRMCAFGQKDKIQISTELFNMVRDMEWEFTPSVAKIKEGLVNTYLVAPKHQANIVKKITGLYSISAASDYIQQQPIKEPKRKRSTSDSKVLDTSVMPLISGTEGLDVQPTFTVREDLKSIESVEVVPCQFSESKVQRDYRIFYVVSHLRSIVRGLWMTICIYILDNAIFITAFVVTEGSHGSTLQVALRLLCMLGMATLIFISRCFHKSRLLHWCTITLYTCCSLVSVLMLYTIHTKFVYIIVLEVMYTNVIYNHISGIPFKYIVIGSLCILTPWVCIASTIGLESGVALETTLFVVLFTVLNGAASYAREWQNRKTYILNEMQSEEQSRTENLLKKMMPKHVYNMMQTQMDPAPYDVYERTTILYADICGFTIWGKNKSPAEVVGMLSRLYSNFDNLTVKHHVYKVHTIGDCYVVLGLSDQEEPRRDYATECENVVNLSMDMVRSIKQLNVEVENLNIGMRIGIHTGKITGGFAGTIVVRYDIYGAAVTKANKMESGGTKNLVNVSYKTKQLLQEKCPDRFDYVLNEKNLIYEPKNKPIPAFYLQPKDPSDAY